MNENPTQKRVIATTIAAALLLVLASAGGCGSTNSGIQGVSCATDGDCNPGLQCLPYQVFGDGGAACASLGRECLKACHTDADCKAQGPGLVCFSACGATAACEDPSTLGTPPDAGTEASRD